MIRLPLRAGVFRFALAACLLLVARAGFAEETLAGEGLAPEDIKAPHVLQLVGLINNEIDEIRLVMGERPPRSREFTLQDVQPRQPFFQSQTLFLKCNQLAKEVAGVSRQAPRAAPEDGVDFADIYRVVDESRAQLQIVRDAIGIETAVTIPPLPRRSTPEQIMHDIVKAGDVLNQLIIDRPEWPDIYDRITQMITYIAGVLPESNRFPELSPYECCKQPQDVATMLLDAMELARPVAESVDLSVIRIVSEKAEEGGASTDTVYDVTTTVVSDFAELTLRLDGEDLSNPEYPRPTRIFPSHAYQMARVVKVQIEQLVAMQ